MLDQVSVHRVSGRPRGLSLLALAIGGATTATAAALLPAVEYLRSPAVLATAAGLVVLGMGLAVLALTGLPEGRLLVLAGFAWYLPDLALTGLDAVDTVLARTSLVHLGLLVHVVASGTGHRRTPVLIAVAAGWLAAASAVTGGYRITVPLAAAALLGAVVLSPDRFRGRRVWHRAAGVVLAGGLLLETLLRLGHGVAAERTTSWLHPLLVATTAALVALGLTLRTRLATTDLSGAGVAQVEPTLARHLGVDRLTIRVPDGEGGWLDVGGCPAPATGTPVNLAGRVIASVAPPDQQHYTLDRDARVLLELVAANAQLRRSIGQHLDGLQASRRRLLRAQDVARAEFDERLRWGPLASLEQLAQRMPGPTRDSIVAVRDRLADLGRGLDPLAPDGSLVRALGELASRAPVQLSLRGVIEIGDDAAARAVYFLCSEAVANAAKYAPGSPVTVAMTLAAGVVGVEVCDRGPGGADARGSGLLGVADRVETLGGRFQLVSDLRGTTLAASLPVSSVAASASSRS